MVTGTRIASLADVDRQAILLFDLSPQPFLKIAGDALPDQYHRELSSFRYGPGVFKVDWALRESIPWAARECRLAGTVHVGGTLEEIAQAERAAAEGTQTHRPFVIVTQPSLFDSSRAPAGRHTAWAYCHVPHASTVDMTAAIESQIERFAPGFQANILARHTSSPARIERNNANMVGGDISGGAHTLKQLLFRPTRSLYRTPLRGVYLCSSSTPPGGGVHGMCGFHAAKAALTDAGIPQVRTR